MPLTYTIRCLADPRKITRHYYVLEPFLPKDFESLGCKQYSETMKKMFEECKEFILNERLLGGLKIFNMLHKCIAENTEKLKGKNIIFISGLSKTTLYDKVEVMDYSRRIGVDPTSQLNILAEELGKQAIDSGISLERLIFFPISPFIFPFQITENKISLVYKEEMEKINNFFVEKKRQGFGDLEKIIGETKLGLNNYQFNISLYETAKAKSAYLYEDVSEIKGESFDLAYCTRFNRLLLQNAMKFFVKRIDLRKGKFIDLYVTKTSYQHRIFEKIALEEGFELYDLFDFQKGEDEKKYALDSELDYGCLRRFKKRVRNLYGDEKRESRENLL